MRRRSLARLCGNGHCAPQGGDRDFVRGRLSEARLALQGSARPSRTCLRGGEDRGKAGCRNARARLRGDRKGWQDRPRRHLQQRRRPDYHGAHRARRAADGRENRSSLCQSRQDRMERSRDVCGTQLRPRHPHGQLGRHGEDADWTEGPVARHLDVHRATGRRNRGGRQGHVMSATASASAHPMSMASTSSSAAAAAMAPRRSGPSIP